MTDGSDPYKPYHFFRECNENIQVHIVTFLQLVLLLSSAQNCKKNIFLDNFKTIMQEENMEIRRKTSFYLNLLFLFCFALFVFVFGNSQKSF